VRKNKGEKKTSPVARLVILLFVSYGAIILCLLGLFFYPNDVGRSNLAAFLVLLSVLVTTVITIRIIKLQEAQVSEKLERTGRLFPKKQPELEDVLSQAPEHYRIGDDGEIIELNEKAKRSKNPHGR
jgi:hypothetical protein